MKSKISYIVGLVACSFSIASATIINDVYAPDWRGDDNTTYQAWSFEDNGANPAAPELMTNAYGGASAQVVGVGPETYWIDNTDGHLGVWKMYGDGFMVLDIHNTPEQNEQKIINLQMTYSASGALGSDPELFIFSTPTATNLQITQLNKGLVDEFDYYLATWEIIIEPNPSEEWIKIQPRDCTIFIDEIVVDTICIPEPASMVMLVGASSMLAFIRRIFIG